MDDEVFCHGSTGQWIVTICYLRQAENGGAAIAEIRFLGELQCRLSLNRPMTSRDALVEKLRLRCTEWMEHAEAKTSVLPPDEASARLTLASWRRGEPAQRDKGLEHPHSTRPASIEIRLAWVAGVVHQTDVVRFSDAWVPATAASEVTMEIIVMLRTRAMVRALIGSNVGRPMRLSQVGDVGLG